jgi:hypothetical protein
MMCDDGRVLPDAEFEQGRSLIRKRLPSFCFCLSEKDGGIEEKHREDVVMRGRRDKTWSG